MKLENVLMRILFGLFLITTHLLLKGAYNIVNRPTPNNPDLNQGYYDYWLFVGFIYWASLIAGASLLLIGTLQLIKAFMKKNCNR